MGTPGGGDYDIEPPKFTGSDPAPNAVRFDKNKITLVFDEYIAIDKPSEKVIITPPQKKAPVIKAVGKRITVELKDSLKPDMTYTFDFTNGIVDNNERNVLDGFSFAFSTGDVVDSLVLSGLLLNAENLEPMPNTMVGIHSNLSDTAFTTIPFLRTSQTNEVGRFWIRNVAPGTYHLFALNDINRDFKFDQPGEAIAFNDSLIIPSFEPAVRMDTVWKDSLTVDTIQAVPYTRFTPDDLLLRLFKEDFEWQYLSKTERNDPRMFTMNFNAPVDTLPEVYLLDDDDEPHTHIDTIETDWYVLEQSPDRKTLTYWMMDSTLYQKDTIRIETGYLAHDTLNNIVTITDTIQLVKKKTEPPKEKEKDKKKGVEKKRDVLEVTVSPGGAMDVFDTVRITFSEPLASFEKSRIQIRQKVDTLWELRDFPVRQDTLNPRVYYVDYVWPYGQEYQIGIDSMAFSSIYGKENDSIKVNFKTKEEKEYGQLVIYLSGNTSSGFGQLLDGSEKIVKESPLEASEIVFYDIKPGKYYVRYIEDTNGNGKWDPGNYAENRQPEPVYYNSKFFEMKAMLEVEENWNVRELPVEKQKPLEITKNKPKEKQQPKRENKKNENKGNPNRQMQGQGQQGQRMPGMPRL
ncbi:hypothetical protein FACS189421_09540 [Bacteroidia bacterium]|nr:hypothetical protein FACS189421_09540 [Bacteroidia bacterium]